MKNVLVVFADGFEEIEAIGIVDVLRRAGITVVMASIDGTCATVKGAQEISVTVDASLDSIDLAEMDGIILPGGLPGSENLAQSQKVIDLLRQMHGTGKLVAAICAAPIALQAAGVIEGRKFTCYPGFEEQITDGQYTGNRVEIDGRLVTGAGPGAALEFALALVDVLGFNDTAGQLKQGMLIG